MGIVLNQDHGLLPRPPGRPCVFRLGPPVDEVGDGEAFEAPGVTENPGQQVSDFAGVIVAELVVGAHH